ncbi:F-box/LRR-repeat protein 7-like [Frankliniella occidentalis]|uniref:F-box/LRR-repeat protein 7-like n=1 Tax=Frankliniella occidentalis TaxID=133901 RepID=A0A6J1SK12_FRAOC|nr:F-box/LRR-repeat protein 7-like [Frankliniella occidentalis]
MRVLVTHLPANNTPDLLPNEILLSIFKYINSHDLLYNVANVCKRWHILTQDSSLWRSRSIDDEDMLMNDLQLLALAPTLNRVSLHTDFPKDEVLSALLSGSKDLQSLKLHFREGPLSVPQLKDLLPAFPNLRSLDLQLPSASHDQALFSAFHALIKLESLRLTGFVSPVSELLNAITVHCISLHTLHLVDCLIFFRDEHLVALVSDGRPWKSLKLVTYFISEAAYNYFACLKELQQLALIKCKSLTEENLLQIASLPHLTELTISENCLLSSSGLSTCFQIQPMASLLDIDLTVYRADDDVALAIATTCSQLVRLRLAMCLLTDDGLRSIILNASKLQDLDLECNIIRGQCLYLIPNHLPNLIRLNIHLCYNVLVNLNEIVARLTTLKIIDPAGIVLAGRAVKSNRSFAAK